MWSHRDPSLRKSGNGNTFVKNLAKSIDNKTLFDTFSMFGNILSCKVARGDDGEHLGYGFVHYENQDCSCDAIHRVDGMIIAGHKVSVSPFLSRKERGGDKLFTNVYVKNLPGDFTQEQLEQLFLECGEITSSHLPDKDNAEGKTKFGFVNFQDPKSAAKAIEKFNEFELGEKKLYVARAEKKEERQKKLLLKYEALRIERLKKFVGVNLYVKNLGESIGDDRLREEFAVFGQIESAKVMVDLVSHKSQGYGFVSLSSPDEATNAVTKMNGKMLENKPLYVGIAQPKEVRRAHLAARYASRAMGMGIPQQTLYAPQHVPGRVIYPNQMPPQVRNGGWGARGPQGGGGRPGPLPMMLPHYGMQPVAGMPINGSGHPQGNQQQGGQRRQRAQQHQGGQRNDRQRNQVRNRDTQQANHPQQAQTSTQVLPPATGQQTTQPPLTIAALAAAPEEHQKQMIGERLFPLIVMQEQELAGKITGMLLEMDNAELLHLIESPDARQEKINEALAVLNSHP